MCYTSNMAYLSARRVKEMPFPPVFSLLLLMTRAYSCLSKHVSTHSGDLGFFAPFYFVWYKWLFIAVHSVFVLLINSYTWREEILVYISFWIDRMINVILNTLNLVLFNIFPILVLFKRVGIFFSFHEKCYHWSLGLLRIIYKLLWKSC